VVRTASSILLAEVSFEEVESATAIAHCSANRRQTKGYSLSSRLRWIYTNFQPAPILLHDKTFVNLPARTLICGHSPRPRLRTLGTTSAQLPDLHTKL
jgi:hypothetical protein